MFDLRFAGGRMRYLFERSPGWNFTPLAKGSGEDWDELVRHFRAWTEDVYRELDSIDPWAEFASVGELSRRTDEAEDNSPFTDEEGRKIAVRLTELRRQIEESAELSTEQRLYVARQMEYLRDASTRLGRKDWLMLLLGTVSSFVVSVALNVNQIGPMLERVLHGFKAISS